MYPGICVVYSFSTVVEGSSVRDIFCYATCILDTWDYDYPGIVQAYRSKVRTTRLFYTICFTMLIIKDPVYEI